MSRRLDLSQFRGEDSDSEDLVIPTGKRTLALDALKSKTFSHGITKKTKKDLEKEAEERKRADEEKAAAIAYAEFTEAFDVPSGPPSNKAGPLSKQVGSGRGGFVRAGDLNQASNRYVPPRGPAAMGYVKSAPTYETPSMPSLPKAKGKRAMDQFLEEIKRGQKATEDRLGKAAKLEGSSITALAAREHGSGDNFQESTNLYIANLPANITEESLGIFFAEHGAIATVKIMWPRGDALSDGSSSGRAVKAGLSGFVSYMEREDAEVAICAKDGVIWSGTVLRVGFSKPVPKPAKALYYPPETAIKRRRLHSPSGDYEAGDRYRDEFASATSTHLPLNSAKPSMLRRESSSSITDIKAERGIPGDRTDFPDIEQDSERSSRNNGFDDDGYGSLYSSDSAEESEQERVPRGSIGRLGQRRLEAILRVMTGKRAEIARGMEFAVKRAEAADSVAQLVCQSMCIASTPIPRKLARLHLISDILHNSASSLPNVWRYRHAFETRMPQVFLHLAKVHQSLEGYAGKISAEIFKSQVIAVMEIWDKWNVFTFDVSSRWRALLDGTEPVHPKNPTEQGDVPAIDDRTQRFKSSGFKSSFVPIIGTNTLAADALPSNQQEMSEVDLEELDGQVMDGATDQEGIDVDGESMSDDLDGEPADT